MEECLKGLTTRSGMARPTVVWTLPHQSLIQKMPQRLAYMPTGEGIFSREVPSSQMISAYVKLGERNSTMTGLNQDLKHAQ